MRGLLLKEWYLLKKHCGGYLLAVVIFVVLSLMGSDSAIVVIYPGILASLIPHTLLSLDAQNGWNRYCGILPYSKAQIVSAKYLAGLSAQVIAFLLSGIAQAFIMTQQASVRLDIYFLKISITLIASFVLSSVSLPLVFRFGARGGHIAYAVIPGAVCALLITFAMLIPSILAQELPSIASLSIFCLIAIAMYVLSWRLSVLLYRKTDLS